MNTHRGLDSEPTHLDYNATAPVAPVVITAMVLPGHLRRHPVQ
jgi:hypothetical protein